MNSIVTLIRFPFGMTAIITVSCFFLVLFVLESVLALIVLPFAAIIMTRDELHSSWLGSYPNMLRMLSKIVSRIWEWIVED